MSLEKGLILLLCCSHFIDAEKPIDMDYYLSYLRNTNCYSKAGLRNCEENCRNVPVICHDGECFCHQSVIEAIGPPISSIDLYILAPKRNVQIKIASKIGLRKDEDISEIMITEEALRPALRHQIAHFCPDLEVARECIRKCINEGKPAFCGKDHTCYCGHKYGHNDKNKKQNALDVYKDFSDMYDKYLMNGKFNRDVEYDENNKHVENGENNKDVEKVDNKKDVENHKINEGVEKDKIKDLVNDGNNKALENDENNRDYEYSN